MSADFSIDPALNLPITGGEGNRLDRSRLRLIKDELVYNPRASKSYLATLTKQFMPAMRPAIDELPKDAHLIVMPSSSGRNIVPAMIGKFALKQRPDLTIVNVRPEIISAAYKQQSKIKGKYAVLAEDPRRFEFSDNKIQELSQRKAPTFILDDSISTGETAILLQRQLLKRGVHAQGIVTAVASGRKYTYPSDLQRVYGKVTQDFPASYSADQIRSDINTQFAGFPRKKIADFERAIAGSGAKQRDQALYYLRQSSAYYHSEEIDPENSVRRVPDHRQKLSTYQQLKAEFPNLNDLQINRYVKLLDKEKTSSIPKLGKDKGVDFS